MPSRLRARAAFVGVLAVVIASGQAATAVGAPTPPPSPASSRSSSISSPSPAGKSARIAVEQSRADSTQQALGLDSGEKLVVKDVITDPDGTTHVRYNRTYDGLRVIGGDFVSHRDRSGKIEGVNWNGSPEVVVASTKPKLSLASAQATGSLRASLVQKTTAATKGELVVYSGGASSKAKPKLAYDVLTAGVRADQTPSRVHTILDASTGATLSSWDEIENGAGNGIYSGPVTIGTTPGPPWTLRDAAGNSATELNGATSTSTGTTFTDADDIWGNGAVTDRASAAVDAQYGAEKTFDYFKNIQGRNGIWNTGVGARSRVHYGDNYANAYWDGTQMTYGDGAGNAHPLVELDVAGHEMTHGVTENTAGLVETGEAGGLNEATSDIFGTSVEWYAANPADNPDYLIGERVDINGDGSPLRYMDRPSRDGVSPDCWSPTLGNLDVHFSAGPLDHWFYLASEGSGAKTVNGVSYNSPTCNASTVTPIGREVAARIWYRTLTTYLTSSNSYDAAREGAIQSAKDLYGAGSAQCLGVAAAFSAIAVPAGAQTCAVASPPQPGSNLLSNPGFESGDTLWSSTADVIAQWGSAGQPARTGTWSAWLGGYGSAHDDSISQLVSIPASSSATLSYYAHVDTFEAAGTTVYDTMTVRVGSTALQTMSNVDAANGYVLKTVNLSAYVGQTVSLSFSGAEDASAATSFVLDDLSLTTPSVAAAPGAPTAVAGTAGNTQAAVSWTPPASNGGSAITVYTVTATPGGQTATTTGATSATVTGLTNGTAYTFAVTATNTVGTSAASVASAAVTPRTIPGAPTGVSAVPGNTQAAVSWAAPASNGGSAITGYTVTATPGGRTATSTGATSATVTGLTNGTAYMFAVTAANVAGTSLVSVASAAVTPRAVPGAPTGVTATPGNAQGVVSWRAPASNGGSAITGYTVTATPGGQTATTTGVTSATVAGLSNGTTYTFTVTATNIWGTSPGSMASGTVTPNTLPGAPIIGTASALNASAVVRWTAPVDSGGVLTGYSVRAVNSSTSQQVGPQQSAAAGATSLTVTGLTNGTKYAFQVLATNAVGPGPYSAMSNGATPAAPPVTVQVTRLSDFNRDGFTDLVARDSAGNLWLYPGNGAGGFKARYQMGSGWNTMTALVTPGDVTGDGIADILARTAAGALWIYPGNGAGGLGAKRQIGAGWQDLTITNAGDMTGDGRPDVLARDAGGNLWVYPLAGNAVFQTRRLNSSGWSSMTAITGPGDVSGDGRADILGRDGAGLLMLYRGNGSGGLIGGVTARTVLSAGWTGMSALITPGNWDRASGNDLLARDAAGALWLFAGDNAGGLAAPRLIGSGWNGMTYIG